MKEPQVVYEFEGLQGEVEYPMTRGHFVLIKYDDGTFDVPHRLDADAVGALACIRAMDWSTPDYSGQLARSIEAGRQWTDARSARQRERPKPVKPGGPMLGGMKS